MIARGIMMTAALCFALSSGISTDASAQTNAASLLQESYDKEAVGNYQESLTAMVRLPAPERDGYVAQFRRGWLLYKLARNAEAVDAYTKAIALEPKSVEARVGALLPLLALRRWNDAEAMSREVLKTDPSNYYANLRLAFSVYNLGRYADSEELYRKLSEQYPSDVDVRCGLGWALLKLGKGGEAAKIFARVLEISPRNALARDGLMATGLGG